MRGGAAGAAVLRRGACVHRVRCPGTPCRSLGTQPPHPAPPRPCAGGNLGFETAPFKLSYEMTQLLDPGGSRASPTFRRFTELTIRGFLAARSVADSICAAVAMMAPSQVRRTGAAIDCG